MAKISFQAGGAVINQLGRLCARYPGSIKLYGNALNLGNAQFIAERGIALVLRNIGRGLDYGWNADYRTAAAAVADAHIAALGPYLKFDPWVECHNEPPAWNDGETLAENIERAKRGNEWQVIVAARLHAAGFGKVLAYSFNTGGPHLETWQYLQDGVQACEALALHEYSRGLAIPEAGLTYRYRETYRQMPVKRAIMLTELGLGFDAGYQSMTDMAGYLAYLSQLEAEFQKDAYLLAAHLFILSADSAQWSSWDVQNDAEFDRFMLWLGRGTVAPPKEIAMRTPLQIQNAAWKSMGVTHKADSPSAFETKALALALGYPLGEEYEDRPDGITGATTSGQCFGPEGVALECIKGDWGNIHAYSIMTGLPWVRPPAPVPLPGGTQVQPPLPYKFPQALSDIGALGREGVRIPGLPFYRLSGATVRRGVSAFCKVSVFSARGTPAVGVCVTNTFPDGNGEFVLTDGDGNASFQFAASSAFSSPGGGPFAVVLAESALKDNDSIPKRLTLTNPFSDVAYSLGDFQAEHTEISLQFIEQ